MIIRLESVLKTSLQDVLKMSWRRLEKVLKMSWRRLENILKHLGDVLKMSWRHLENLWKMSWRRMTKTNILVLIKTSSEDVWVRRIYSSWSRRLENIFWRRRRKTSSRRLHQDECLMGNMSCSIYHYDLHTKHFPIIKIQFNQIINAINAILQMSPLCLTLSKAFDRVTQPF